MVNTETLRRELTEYDGRNPTILAEMSRRHHDHAAFLSELVSLASDAETVVSEGATWITAGRGQYPLATGRPTAGKQAGGRDCLAGATPYLPKPEVYRRPRECSGRIRGVAEKNSKRAASFFACLGARCIMWRAWGRFAHASTVGPNGVRRGGFGSGAGPKPQAGVWERVNGCLN